MDDLQQRIETVLNEQFPGMPMHSKYAAERLISVLQPDIDTIAEAIRRADMGFDGLGGDLSERECATLARAAVDAWMST